MELRRNRRSLAPGVLLLAFGLSLLLGSPGMGTSIFASAALLTGGWITARSLRPFRFRIGPDGLDLRVAGLNRLASWAEINTIVLGQPARATPAGTGHARLGDGAASGGQGGAGPHDAHGALRGYDMGQVDAYLERLSAALANEPGEPAQPRQPE
ncbi:DivIVA domain-containing protein [Verrucosispora sp. WMMD573]|uniref:DivIVA domain-containing protein n=1 Tax=Verrucosispora sp. WMMD573 TaxID=3015149 RepID=UPI00248AED10|nr:DivIVA domain-containing protein [Verrucosispora sp. WMMD573]WBB56697.1 DivIVA domain-containing protein [Verrucosispora sp. WMMD573]